MSGGVAPGATYKAQLYDDKGNAIGSPVTCYNGTGRELTIGERVVVELPDPTVGCASTDPFACRPPGYSGGYLTVPGAASDTTVSTDPANLNYPDGTAVYRTSGGWSLLNSKLAVPAVCGLVFNKSVVVMGEVTYNGTPGAIRYAALTDGATTTVPPEPVTEADPANEQWIRVLALQVSPTRLLVNPAVIPVRPLPVAMCQGPASFNYRLARFGNF
jgi:hypothetical protein